MSDDPGIVVDMAIDISIVFHAVWPRLQQYLLVERCPNDGGTLEDPRVRIGFVNLPERFGRECTHVTMPCVNCLRAIQPLRRREGDDFTRLYYGCTCPVAVRKECSKGRAAMLEYQRFKGLQIDMRPPAQLALF